MKTEHFVYIYSLAILAYVGMEVFQVQFRILDSFLIMLCGLCVVVSLASIVKILAENKK